MPQCASDMADAPAVCLPTPPSPAIAASFHEFHAQIFPLFFPTHVDMGLCPIRVNNSVISLSLSGVLNSSDDNKLGAGHRFLGNCILFHLLLGISAIAVAPRDF